MQELQIFKNEEFREIRTSTIDNEPWFVGKDVAKALGYTNERDALTKHVEEEDKGVAKCNTPGGKQDMSELIKINYSAEKPTVSARDLYEGLEIRTRFADWFPRMAAYGFEENADYVLVTQKRETNNPKNPLTEFSDYQISIDMAKQTCMIQRTEKGRMYRQYFLDLEKAWNTPEMILSRALKVAEQQMKQLQIRNSQLTVDNQIMKPKAEYFDELVERGLNTGIRETAKELGIKERKFINFLLEKKYLYRGKSGSLQPYAQYTEDLFVLKERFNEKSGWTGTQVFITPKGKETFRLLCLEAV